MPIRTGRVTSEVLLVKFMLGCLKESCGLSRELQQKDLGNFAVHTLGIEADANENPIDL